MTTTATISRPQRAVIGGWPIVAWAAAGVIAIVAASLAIAGTGEDGVRMVVRATARTSVVLFGLAFVASSWQQLWPGTVGRWLLSNRRYLGVSFAFSHAMHLAAIVTLARVFNVELGPLILAVGGFGYVLLAAMTATSFDRTAHMLGARRWKLLHGFGARYLWLVFFASYLPAGEIEPIPTVFFLLVVAMAVVRASARIRARAAS